MVPRRLRSWPRRLSYLYAAPPLSVTAIQLGNFAPQFSLAELMKSLSAHNYFFFTLNNSQINSLLNSQFTYEFGIHLAYDSQMTSQFTSELIIHLWTLNSQMISQFIVNSFTFNRLFSFDDHQVRPSVRRPAMSLLDWRREGEPATEPAGRGLNASRRVRWGRERGVGVRPSSLVHGDLEESSVLWGIGLAHGSRNVTKIIILYLNKDTKCRYTRARLYGLR